MKLVYGQLLKFLKTAGILQLLIFLSVAPTTLPFGVAQDQEVLPLH